MLQNEEWASHRLDLYIIALFPRMQLARMQTVLTIQWLGQSGSCVKRFPTCS